MRRLRAILLAAYFASLHAQAESPDPRALLDRAREVAGGAALAAVETMVSRIEISAGGLTGTGEVLEDVRGCRYGGSFDLGAVHGAAGFDGKRAWTRDTNGDVQVLDDPEAKRTAANDAYLRCLAPFFPERWPAEVVYDRAHADGSRRFHVLAVTPRDGRPFELWLDAETMLIDRTIDPGPIETRTNLFSDYRSVNGIQLAHGQRSTTGDPRFDQTTRLLGVEINGEIDPGRYAVPSIIVAEFKIAAGRPSTTLPFELSNHHVYVEVLLNGKGPFRMMADVAGPNLLTPAAAAAAGLTVEKGAAASATMAETVGLGEATIERRHFFVLPLDGIEAVEGARIDGLIGWEIFKHFVVGIDYAARSLSLSRIEEFRYAGPARPIPFEFEGYSPRIEARVGGFPAQLTIDMGSRNALTLSPTFVAEHRLAERAGGSVEALIGWGLKGGERGRLLRVGDVELGAATVPGVVADVASGPGAPGASSVQGRIGGGLLKRFHVTLDLPRLRLYLEPNAEVSSKEGWDRTGLWINRDGEAFRVEDVIAGSPAAEAGLAIGDRILAIGGRAAKELSLSDVRQSWRSRAAGTTVQLEVEHDGVSRKVELNLRDVV